MQSELPFYDGIEEALKASINALGGAKAVGSMLFVDKPVDTARDYLLACVNPARNEKLDYNQLIFIFRAAKHKGFHAGFDYFAKECEYEARPVTKAEEIDRVTSVIEAASKALSNGLATLERLKKTA